MTDLVLPLLALAIAAWLVPWGFGKALPEGVAWLFVNGALSAAVLTALSAAGFWWLYGDAGDAVLAAPPWQFIVLAARAAIVWAPIMVLSVANLPRGWREAEW